MSGGRSEVSFGRASSTCRRCHAQRRSTCAWPVSSPTMPSRLNCAISAHSVAHNHQPRSSVTTYTSAGDSWRTSCIPALDAQLATTNSIDVQRRASAISNYDECVRVIVMGKSEAQPTASQQEADAAHAIVTIPTATFEAPDCTAELFFIPMSQKPANNTGAINWNISEPEHIYHHNHKETHSSTATAASTDSHLSKQCLIAQCHSAGSRKMRESSTSSSSTSRLSIGQRLSVSRLGQMIERNLVATLVTLYIAVSVTIITILILPYLFRLPNASQQTNPLDSLAGFGQDSITSGDAADGSSTTDLGLKKHRTASESWELLRRKLDDKMKRTHANVKALSDENAKVQHKLEQQRAKSSGALDKRIDLPKAKQLMKESTRVSDTTQQQQKQPVANLLGNITVSFGDKWNTIHKGSCERVQVPFCSRSINSMLMTTASGDSDDSSAHVTASTNGAASLAYEYTLLPNQFTNNTRQSRIATILRRYESIVEIKCYALMPLFLCSLYMPKCVPANPLEYAKQQQGTTSRSHNGDISSMDIPDGGALTEYEADDYDLDSLTRRDEESKGSAWSRLVPPCRHLCTDALEKCGFFFEVLALDTIDASVCASLPEESPDAPDICVGTSTTKPLPESGVALSPETSPTQRLVINVSLPVTTSVGTGASVVNLAATSRASCGSRNQFKCATSNECIALKWRCDGFADCHDRSDELGCSTCNASTHFHCGSDVCIKHERVCDGARDCTDGRDERQCLRLGEALVKSSQMRRLEVWTAHTSDWTPACGAEWAPGTLSHEACRALGYARARTTILMYNASLLANVTAQSHVTFDHSQNVERVSWPIGAALAQMSEWPNMTAGSLDDDDDDVNVAHNTSLLGAHMRSKKCLSSVYLQCEQFECGRSAVASRVERATDDEPVSDLDLDASSAPVAARLVVGGRESLPGEFPYLAALHGGPDEVFFCGGVLIAPSWLLTAGHCVGRRVRPDGWMVKVGVTRRLASPAHVRKLRVSKIIKHPRFNHKAVFNNDIALLKLEHAVEFNQYLAPACLPRANTSLMAQVDGRDCVVVGFGKPKFSQEANYVQVAHYAQVPIVPQRVCSSWYAEHGVNLTDGMMCAGYAEGKRDACQGDSGSGLFCRQADSSSQYFVAGVVSFGIKCATPKLPGVYTSVPHYIDWIMETMRDNE